MQQLAAFAAARNATYATPSALLPAPVSAVCAALSFTVPVSGPFDRIVTSEDMGSGQVIGGYSVEALIGGNWTPLAVHGVTVGSRIQVRDGRSLAAVLPFFPPSTLHSMMHIVRAYACALGYMLQDDFDSPIIGATALRFNCTSDLAPPTPYQVREFFAVVSMCTLAFS